MIRRAGPILDDLQGLHFAFCCAPGALHLQHARMPGCYRPPPPCYHATYTPMRFVVVQGANPRPDRPVSQSTAPVWRRVAPSPGWQWPAPQPPPVACKRPGIIPSTTRCNMGDTAGGHGCSPWGATKRSAHRSRPLGFNPPCHGIRYQI